jgi:ribosomal-protein-alanine N-acetyltransferase
MIFDLSDYIIEAIHEKHAWRICDLMTINSERFRRFFPETLQQNLTPDLSNYFVQQKVRQFHRREEFLFVLKEAEHSTIIGLVYIKDVDWTKKRAELAYCIGYQYEGRGYTTQSVQKLSDYAFKEFGLKTLQIIVHRSNKGSFRVAEKCGYIWSKTLVKAFTPPNESALDMELYELHYER